MSSFGLFLSINLGETLWVSFGADHWIPVVYAGKTAKGSAEFDVGGIVRRCRRLKGTRYAATSFPVVGTDGKNYLVSIWPKGAYPMVCKVSLIVERIGRNGQTAVVRNAADVVKIFRDDFHN